MPYQSGVRKSILAGPPVLVCWQPQRPGQAVLFRPGPPHNFSIFFPESHHICPNVSWFLFARIVTRVIAGARRAAWYGREFTLREFESVVTTPNPATFFPRLSSMPAEVEDLPALGCVDSPGPHCGLFEAALTGPLFTDAYMLLIAPAACLFHARMALLPRTRGPSRLRDNLLLLPMDQADTVFGVDDRLAEAILEADQRYSPEVLFLVSTCVPEMMGTDLDAMVNCLQDRVRARLLPVRTDGFSGRYQQIGHKRLLSSLVRVMDPVPVRPRTVNILGLRGNGGQETELVRLLKAWGAEVLFVVPSETTLAAVRQAPAAVLNLVVSEMGIDLARAMEQRFGTPYLDVGYPLGAAEVAAAYRAIADTLGIEPGGELAVLEAEARGAMDRARDRAVGMRCAVSAFAGGALGAARFLADLGMEPVVVFLHRLTAADRAERERLLTRGIDPLVAQTRSTQDTADVLQVLRPQVYAGHGDGNAMARQGIAHLHPEPRTALWGFSATCWAAETVAHAACELETGGKEWRK